MVFGWFIIMLARGVGFKIEPVVFIYCASWVQPLIEVAPSCTGVRSSVCMSGSGTHVPNKQRKSKPISFPLVVEKSKWLGAITTLYRYLRCWRANRIKPRWNHFPQITKTYFPTSNPYIVLYTLYWMKHNILNPWETEHISSPSYLHQCNYNCIGFGEVLFVVTPC